MRLNYRLTDDDFVRFGFYHERHRLSAPQLARESRMGTVVLLPLLIVVLAWAIFRSREAALFALLVGAGLGLYNYVKFPETYDREMLKKIRTIIADIGLDGLTGQYCLDLTSDGLVEYTEGQTLTVAWSRIKRVGFDGARLFIYYTSMSTLIVPLSAFREAAEYRVFVDTLRARTWLPLDHLSPPPDA